MKRFSYRARMADGSLVRGSIDAEHAALAARELMVQGKTVVALYEKRMGISLRDLFLRKEVTDVECIALFQEMAVLLGAGLPVHEALARLSSGEETARGHLVKSLHRAVVHGSSLSDAMKGHRVFAPSIIGMVRAGEESGALDVVLGQAAVFLEEGHRVREDIKSALSYPVFLLGATVFAIFLMTVFVLPIFASLLHDLGAELSLLTQVLLSGAEMVSSHPYVLTAILAGLCTAGMAFLRVPYLRLHFDRLLLGVPVFGRFILYTQWRMILRMLDILLRSGIRLDLAVGSAAHVTGNRFLAAELQRAERSLTEGRTLAYALSKINCLPRLIQEMLAAGEEAGALEHLLSQGADYCERTARQLGVRIEAAAEPVMIVLIGAVIFFFVLSLMMPIFTAMDALM